MNQLAVKIKNYFKISWRSFLVRLTLIIIGFFLSTFSIAIYQTTTIGVSQMDFTIYVICAIWKGYDKNTGEMHPDVLKNQYLIIYILVLIIMSLLAICFALPRAIKAWKQENKIDNIIEVIATLLTNIIVAFAAFFLMKIYLNNILDVEEMKQIEQKLKNLIFVASFILFCTSLALWVKGNMLLGPYNSYCHEFQKITNKSFAFSRVMMDLLIFIPGLMLWFLIPGIWIEKTNFLITNLGIGTIATTFLVGPLVNMVLKILNKCFDFKKIDDNQGRRKQMKKESVV